VGILAFRTCGTQSKISRWTKCNFSTTDSFFTKISRFKAEGFYNLEQESRAVARKPSDTAAVVFGLKFADNIHYKFKSSQASKAKFQSSKRMGAKQNLTQNGHSRSRVLESVERR